VIPAPRDLDAPIAVLELPRVRGQALRLLGNAGEAEHVTAVRDRLADEDEAVRRHAARALERLEQRLDLP